MDIVHTKLADVKLYMGQIVPEYNPNDVVFSDEKGLHIPIFGISLVICAAAVGLLFVRMRRRRRKKNHFVDR